MGEVLASVGEREEDMSAEMARRLEHCLLKQVAAGQVRSKGLRIG